MYQPAHFVENDPQALSALMATWPLAALLRQGPDGLLSREVVRHRPVGGKAPVETSGWLPQGPVVVGVTAGASTPDVTIGAVVARVLALRGPTPPAAPPPAP